MNEYILQAARLENEHLRQRLREETARRETAEAEIRQARIQLNRLIDESVLESAEYAA